ncbi:MAG: beta-lactamase family protein [Deltaproteobacteria bacterium]|nr:beta-lactamase family protein [Deltaproteobacteria bacterium]
MSNQTQIKTLLERSLEERVFSAYQLFFERKGKHTLLFGGRTSYWPNGVSVSADTLFDVGSLTKVVLTASAIATEVDRGEIELGAKLHQHVRGLAGSELGNLLIGHLLNHCSGLDSWLPLYNEAFRDLLPWFRSHVRCLEPPGTKLRYSDLGFLLLGFVLTEKHGSLVTFLEERIRSPLAMHSTCFGPLKNPLAAAATEYCLLRKRVIQGEVFDENCWALGHVAAHAGLFSTAHDLAHFCREWLLARDGKSKWLSAKTAKLFSERARIVEGSTWAYGWDTKSAAFSSAGDLFGPRGFGMLGYPGCSLWIDPDEKAFVVFLTNRIHPSRVDERIKKLRPQLHDEIVKVWKN